MKTYKGSLETKFLWLIPFILGVSNNTIDNKAQVFAFHITPFLVLGFNWLNSNNLKNTGHDPLLMTTDDPINSVIDHF
jgi:hypothetical protein